MHELTRRDFTKAIAGIFASIAAFPMVPKLLQAAIETRSIYDPSVYAEGIATGISQRLRQNGYARQVLPIGKAGDPILTILESGRYKTIYADNWYEVAFIINDNCSCNLFNDFILPAAAALEDNVIKIICRRKVQFVELPTDIILCVKQAVAISKWPEVAVRSLAIPRTPESGILIRTDIMYGLI